MMTNYLLVPLRKPSKANDAKNKLNNTSYGISVCRNNRTQQPNH